MSRNVPPTYSDPKGYYPARDEPNLDDLLAVLSADNRGLAEFVRQSDSRDPDEAERLKAILESLGELRNALDTTSRVLAEYALRDHDRRQALTLMEIASRLQAGRATVSRWKHQPLAMQKPE